jgi:Ca2+:H+ antiporter
MRRLPAPSLDWLLVFIPISLAARAIGLQAPVFITSALAIVPLAGLIGRATEQAAIRVGPRRGGLLNATLGNLTELIVAVLLILAGDFAIVKASLVGSIVGNLLLVLGLSFALGGARHPEQQFSARAAAVHSTSLLLAVTGLVMPALFIATAPGADPGRRQALSVVVAAVLIVLYLASLAYMQVTHAHLFHTPDRRELANWSLRRALIVLFVAAGAVGLESELLVSSLRPALDVLHVPALFAGLVLIPVIGNAAEHASAVTFALKNRLDATLEIAVGSSTQIALFVAPALVFISIFAGHPMDFVFTTFEIAVVTLATLIAGLISLDGRTNWLEGVQLLGAYCVMAAAALFVSG